MRFNPKADISGGRIRSRGGSGGGGGLGGLGGALGGGRGLPIPGGLGIKGTIVVIIIYFVLQMCTGGGLPGSGLPGVPGSDDSGSSNNASDTGSGVTDEYASCKTGEDANKSVDCARAAVALSIENFWKEQLGDRWKPATFNTFNGNVQTACGAANAGMGPFYCPADMEIYEDETFYAEVLVGQLDGPKGVFVEPYVLGHEYGHHISNLIGDMGKASGQGAGSGAVNLELQADCFAGLWTQHAESVPDSKGEVIIEDLTDEDIRTAIEAAHAVGDDYIQQKTQGRVDESGWTHGSSAQREAAFKLGYSGDFDSCSWDNVMSQVNES